MAEFLAKKKAAKAAGGGGPVLNLNANTQSPADEKAAAKPEEKAPTGGLCLVQQIKKSEMQWNQELEQLNEYLKKNRLCLRKVERDGNCMFTSWSVQLYGNEDRHAELRQRAVEYLKKHREEYEAFLEDGEKFERYCERMAESGTWGGQMELQMLGALFGCNVLLHQIKDGKPHHTELKTVEEDKPCLQLAYLGGEHYDSVVPEMETETEKEEANGKSEKEPDLSSLPSLEELMKKLDISR